MSRAVAEPEDQGFAIIGVGKGGEFGTESLLIGYFARRDITQID